MDDGTQASGDEEAPARPMRADARRNRLKVISTAERVLASEGSAASMREIARRASVGLATVYRQFPTKEALLEAIVDERINRLLTHAREAADSPHPSEAFFNFFDFAVESATGEKALADSLAQAGIDTKGATQSRWRELKATTATLLARAQNEGGIRTDTTMSEILALIAATSLAADRQQWSTERRRRTLQIIFDGLRAGR